MNTEGLDVLAVHVGGTQVDKEFAFLNVSGGRYPEGGQPISLTWVASAPVCAEQQVSVLFQEKGLSTQSGKTIEELFPDEPPVDQVDFTLTAEMLKDLRAKPRFREKFKLQLVSSSCAFFVRETSCGEHGFGFSVLWNSFYPERARVSLCTYTLEILEKRSPSHNLFEKTLQWGESVALHLA